MTSPIEQLEAEKYAIQQRLEQRKADRIREAQEKIELEKLQCELTILSVAEEFDVDVDYLMARDRRPFVVEARQVAMLLLRDACKMSCERAGELLSGRDHGTVIHGCKTIRDRMSVEPNLKAKVERLKKILTTLSANSQDKAAR